MRAARETVDELTARELEVLAALVTVMVRVDRASSPRERDAIGRLAARLRLVSTASDRGPYRSDTEPTDGEADDAAERFLGLLDAAWAGPLEEQDWLAAACSVERPAGREAIFGLLFDLAASDLVADGEGHLLDRLAGLWQLEVEAVR